MMLMLLVHAAPNLGPNPGAARSSVDATDGDQGALSLGIEKSDRSLPGMCIVMVLYYRLACLLSMPEPLVM